MDKSRKLKRGEILFKEGEVPQVLHLVQSGKVGLMLERGSTRLEIISVGATQVLGESGIFSNAKYPFTAEALQETKVLEVPLEVMKLQFEKSPAGIKLLVKALVDEVRYAIQQLKLSKMDSEKTPCPQGQIHRLFTELHLVARHIGKHEPASSATPVPHIVLSWSAFKLYTTRFFGESPQRMRSLMDLLSKLKLAELTHGKNEEGEEELQTIKLFELQLFEDFAEFFQYHLFKGSRAEAIYVDPLALKVARAMFEISAEAPVNHKGASTIEYSVVVTECKAKYNFDLRNTHIDILEKKGLFVQRKSYDDGRLELLFDRVEFGKMVRYWAILFEIDKWNEKGSVELQEKELPSAVAVTTCPDCKGKLEDQHKFCPSCGYKLAA